MELAEIMEKLRAVLPEVAKRYGVDSLGVFGSYVHGKQRPDSDLDVLVTFKTVPSMLKFVELENYLADYLGLRVDLVMQSALKPNIGRVVMEEVRPV
jgi:hypothetical protein